MYNYFPILEKINQVRYEKHGQESKLTPKLSRRLLLKIFIKGTVLLFEFHRILCNVLLISYGDF